MLAGMRLSGTSSPHPVTSTMLDRLSGWPRRVAALACFAVAALCLAAGRSSSPPTAQPTVVLARSVAAGSTLSASDLTIAAWPGAPPGAVVRSVAAAIGRHTAIALDRGMPVLTSWLLEPRVAAALAADLVATTVTLSDAGQSELIQSGSWVSLYPTSSPDALPGPAQPAGRSQPIASRVQVLSVLPAAGQSQSWSTVASDPRANPTLVIAVSSSVAGQLSAHNGAAFLATLVPPP